MILLFSLLACSSPESRAEKTVRAYVTPDPVSLEGWVAQWDYVCSDDQEAQPREEMLALRQKVWDDPEAQAAYIKYVRDLDVQDASSFLNDEKTEGVVILSTSEGEQTFRVRLEEEQWCVDNDWAEEKAARERTELIESIKSTFSNTESLIERYMFDEVGTRLEQGEKLLEELGEDDPQYSSLQSQLYVAEASYEEQKESWLGGRWTGFSGENTLTRKPEALAMSQAIGLGIRYLGRYEKARLVFRCMDGKLEVYINAMVMLTTNYRYGTTSGKYRFGEGPVTSISGNAGESHKAMFLRNPQDWLDTFQAHDGEEWVVELNPFQQTPATTTFDLTGSTAAVAKVREACPK